MRSVIYSGDTSEELVTHERIGALANICRWGGFTRRFYSVCEHSLIGALAARAARMDRDVQLGFLLHDFEESEFGDKITPLKYRHSSTHYWIDVERFNEILCRQIKKPMELLDSTVVRSIDRQMAWAESNSVSLRPDPKYEPGGEVYPNRIGLWAKDMIESGIFRSRTHQVSRFMEFYHDLTRRTNQGASSNVGQ